MEVSQKMSRRNFLFFLVPGVNSEEYVYTFYTLIKEYEINEPF